jgi:hypothetical protein
MLIKVTFLGLGTWITFVLYGNDTTQLKLWEDDFFFECSGKSLPMVDTFKFAVVE